MAIMQPDLYNEGEYDEVYSRMDNEKLARGSLNAKWAEMWHMYKTYPLTLQLEGEWHSKLNDGRVFELVETVGSYVRNALFFSDNWVQLEAQQPGLAEIVPLVNAYFRDSLNTSNFKREFRLYVAQLLLLGNSAMEVSFDSEQGLTFECLNLYDLYVESNRRFDERYSYTFRQQELNFAEFLALYSVFNELTDDVEEEFERLSKASDQTDGDDAEKHRLPDEEYVELDTYYCPIESKLKYYVGTECIGERKVDQCPWLFASLFETPETAYGMSIIDSSIGLILENNVLLNRRLDNIAVSVDNMWTVVDDGVIKPEEIKTAPGKVLMVGRPDSIQPLHPPTNNFNVTYTEAQVLDTKIDRNIGTGAMISANAYRSGERVTAAEIQSVKDAGGNRLTDIYEHIEFNCILPILKRAYALLKKNVKKAQVVKLPSAEQGVFDYFQMLPEDLSYDFKVSLKATQSVINRDRNVQLLTEFITLVNSVPQFQQLANYEQLYYDLLAKFGFDDPQRYILQAQPEAAEAAPTTPMQEAADSLEQIAPGVGTTAVQGLAASGELPAVAGAFAGGLPPDQTQSIQGDPALQEQILLAANQPV